LNDRFLGSLDRGIPDPPARPISSDHRPVVMLRLVPASNGFNLIVPSCRPDGKYLGTVVQWQNPVQNNTKLFISQADPHSGFQSSSISLTDYALP